MSQQLIKEARKAVAGKATRLDDEELEYLAKEISKLGFKLGFARAYAAGPTLVAQLVKELERKEAQLEEIKRIVTRL
jgi:hypothetical protein